MKKKLLVIGGALVCVFALVLFFKHKPVLAVVGDYKITKEAADYRNRVIRVYYPQENRSLGIDQLVRAYTYAQILKNNGAEITESVLDKEVERIDKHTLVPETLSRIKGIFGPDVNAYRQVFVLPTYSERVIYFEYFLRDPKPQAAAVKPADDFLNAVKATPAEFAKIAEGKHYKVQTFQVSFKEGLKDVEEEKKKKKDLADPLKRNMASQNSQMQAPPHLDQRFRAQMDEQREEEAKKWINEILKPLKPGAVYSKLVDQGQQWYVVRFSKVEPKKNVYEFEAVSFPKAEYGEWLEAETKKVKVERYDDSKVETKEKKSAAG